MYTICVSQENRLQEIEDGIDPKYGEVVYYWVMPEFHRHERTAVWYGIFIVLMLGLIVWSIVTANYIFAVFLVLFGMYMIMQHFRDPENVPVVILTTGIAIGDHYHTWDEVSEFFIVYNPPEVQKLYFNFVKRSHPIVSIDLPDDLDPNELREELLEYVDENLDKDQETLTDVVRRLYKL